MDYIQSYLDYFIAHPDWAIVLIFLIAFGEALLILGLFVPSTVILVSAGALVGTGHLPFWPVFLATCIGAIAGDQISYWVGRLYGTRLKTYWPLNYYPVLVARGEDFVRRHGGKSIAIGRFIPGVKAVVPGIVGMLGMGQLYFAAINISSGLVWSAAHVLPGILLGQSLAFASELSGRLVLVLLTLLGILALAGYVIRMIAGGLSPYFSHVLDRIAAWARSKKSRSMQRLARAVTSGNPRSALVVLFAAIVFTGVIVLADMSIGIMSNQAVSNIDVSVFNLLKEMRNAPADEIMITITMLGDGLVMTALAAAIIIWLIGHKAYRAALAATIAVLAGKIFVPVLKYGIQRPRPVEFYSGAELFSFPSGHATMAALIFGILAVLVSHSMGRWARALVYAVCALAVVAIAYSRVYLGAHWLSDVLGGLLFGSVVAAAFGVAIEAIPPRRIKPVGLFGAALIVFITAGAFHVFTGYERAEAAYAPPQIIANTTVGGWQLGGWKQLPVRRIDLAGKPEEVFLVQLAGNLDTFRDAMTAAGWTATTKWTWRDSLPYLNPNATLAELPPRPALHEGLKAKLTLIRSAGDTPDQRQVLRIYKTNLQAIGEEAPRPIYLVSLRREHAKEGLNLYAVPSALAATGGDETALHAAFETSTSLKLVGENLIEGMRQALVVTLP
ncbi:MAG: phosphatase PAP2 family protein [Aestuariivirga sp.]